MADSIVSTNALDDLFADIVQEFTGLAAENVLISYSERGQMTSTINQDVCYIHSEQIQDSVEQYKSVVSKYNSAISKFIKAQSSMRTINLKVVLYGPNSDVLAVKIKEKFYLQSANEKLYMNNLALIPGRENIAKTHEKVNERWWDRVDLDMYFYNSVTIEDAVETMNEVDIKYKNDLEV